MQQYLILFAALMLAATACSGAGDADSVVVYSGRSQELIQPLIDRFEEEAGIQVEVRYAGSAELAATILEEGDNSPADLFLAQDPASLGVVALAGMLMTLDSSILDKVDAAFSDTAGRWVGLSGRSRTVVYDTTKLDASELPTSEDGFTDPAWANNIAIAPTNGSFLAFVAAKVVLDGEEATLAWLEDMAANAAPRYPKNSAIVEAVDLGEVSAGFVNHYYLLRRTAELGERNAANHFLSRGAGALVMPSGAGILRTATNGDAAVRFIEFMLATESQQYFVDETFEYPLVAGIAANRLLPALDSLAPPTIDLSRLAQTLDLAIELVSKAGLL